MRWRTKLTNFCTLRRLLFAKDFGVLTETVKTSISTRCKCSVLPNARSKYCSGSVRASGTARLPRFSVHALGRLASMSREFWVNSALRHQLQRPTSQQQFCTCVNLRAPASSDVQTSAGMSSSLADDEYSLIAHPGLGCSLAITERGSLYSLRMLPDNLEEWLSDESVKEIGASEQPDLSPQLSSKRRVISPIQPTAVCIQDSQLEPRPSRDQKRV